jgi:hypothetical protein
VAFTKPTAADEAPCRFPADNRWNREAVRETRRIRWMS